LAREGELADLVNRVATRDEFLDQRPIGRDPYGWAVLRTLGLAIGVRLFDMVAGDFVESKMALPLIQGAFAEALTRYPGQSLGAPTVETLARAEGLYTLASFDGGSPAAASDDSFANELASLTQLSLRPIAEDLGPIGASAACLYYGVQASPDAMTISVNVKDAAGAQIVAEPLLIDLIDISSGSRSTIRRASPSPAGPARHSDPGPAGRS
jgi:hypothetical protein